MEVRISREIREYTESMFFGLSMRQFFFSVLAIIVAVSEGVMQPNAVLLLPLLKVVTDGPNRKMGHTSVKSPSLTESLIAAS